MTCPAAMLHRCLTWLGPRHGQHPADRSVPAKPGRRPSPGRLRALVGAMAAAGLGPASINRHLSALRTHYPGLKVPWQKEPRGRTRTVTPVEAAALAARIGDPFGALVTFLAETGLRVGEAWELKEADVQGGWATVRDSKNGDPRKVPLTDLAGQAWLGTGGRGWSRLSRSSFQHAFRQACLALGLHDLRPHDLRHSAASRLIDAGAPLPTVSAWLGHRDPRSTLRYVHVSSKGLLVAKELLEGVRGV